MLRRVADEKRLPFEVTVPNAVSRAAMAELDAGKGKRFKSAEALFDDLGILGQITVGGTDRSSS